MDFVYHCSFYTASILVAPIWLMMVFLPNWPFTRRMMGSLLVVLPFALTYAILETPEYCKNLLVLAVPNFDKINGLLHTIPGTSQAWVHFITMDLFAGRWIYLDSYKQGFNQRIISGILASTLVFGPSGLTIYLLYRYWKLKTWNPDAPATVAANS